MEAALRTVYEKLTGHEAKPLEFEAVRGFDNIKEAVIQLNDKPVKVAIVHTLLAARQMMERLKSGACDYTFIEVMACPGGCIGGGGQPIGTTNSVRQARIKALYEIDRHLPYRKSHENPDIIKLYDEFLGEPLGETAHALLHTHYHHVHKKYEFADAR